MQCSNPGAKLSTVPGSMISATSGAPDVFTIYRNPTTFFNLNLFDLFLVFFKGEIFARVNYQEFFNVGMFMNANDYSAPRSRNYVLLR